MVNNIPAGELAAGMIYFMDNDVAIYLDLDNVLIGATEANLSFDINLILDHVASLTNGRIVLRRAYGDWRQQANQTKALAAAGFELQSTVRLSSNSKNLADMQMVVDAMSTLVDRQEFTTYVLVTGDRDFAPLVQALRKRGKQVIGTGVRHTTSLRLAHLCDHYFYYDQLVAAANQIMDDQLADLLQRAMDQLLQDKSRVPASLLKQRVQALSKGAFNRSALGKGSFSKVLMGYPHIVQFEQEGTTLYVHRPQNSRPTAIIGKKVGTHIPDEEVRILLKKALDELLDDRDHVRASLLKQRMQDLSDSAFDETMQGDKSFRKFLDHYGDLVLVEQEGSTLYARRTGSETSNQPAVTEKHLSSEEALTLLQAAISELLIDQSRVRASLLKQRMQELSNGTFDEGRLGYDTYREFLAHYPDLIQVQQKGTTLLVHRPKNHIEPEQLHLLYRSSLKKRGLRVVPSEIRLQILKDMITLLEHHPKLEWRQLVNQLVAYYVRIGREDISKSYVNDVLRVARRAMVVGVDNGKSLAKAPVYLRINGQRAFQDAVIRCDVTYLKEIQNLADPFDLEQASVALYESVDHTRYLKVLLSRFSENGQNA
jgi:hypothetical protein